MSERNKISLSKTESDKNITQEYPPKPTWGSIIWQRFKRFGQYVQDRKGMLQNRIYHPYQLEVTYRVKAELQGQESLRNNVGLNRIKLSSMRFCQGFVFGLFILELIKFTCEQNFWFRFYHFMDITEHYMAIYDKNSGPTKVNHANFKINKELRQRGNMDFLSHVTLSQGQAEISPEMAYHSFMIASYKFPDKLRQNSYQVMETGDEDDNKGSDGIANANEIIRGLFDDST